jgi:predicted MPP superfamily phosphohydrolase
MLKQLLEKSPLGTLPSLRSAEYLKKVAALTAICAEHRQLEQVTYKKPAPYASLQGIEKLSTEIADHLGLGCFSEGDFRLACKLREQSLVEKPARLIDGINLHEYSVPLLSMTEHSRFNGHRILHLSDIHLHANDDWMVKRLQSIAETLPTLKIDTIAITGDLADNSPTDISPKAISALAAIARQASNVFFTPGNHDYNAGIESVITSVRAAGITVLIDEHLTLEDQGDRLQFVGLDDAYHRLSEDPNFFNEPCLTSKHLDADSPTIVLAHSIDSLCAADSPIADLVLSGHTHGLMFKGVPYASLFLEHHFGQKLLYHHNKQGSGIKALSPRTISVVSNGLVDRYRHGFLKTHPFVQSAEAIILELRPYKD